MPVSQSPADKQAQTDTCCGPLGVNNHVTAMRPRAIARTRITGNEEAIVVAVRSMRCAWFERREGKMTKQNKRPTARDVWRGNQPSRPLLPTLTVDGYCESSNDNDGEHIIND